jgi:hypothetical protein
MIKVVRSRKSKKSAFRPSFSVFRYRYQTFVQGAKFQKVKEKKNQWPTALPKVSHKGENALPIICFCGCFSPHVRTASIYAAAAPV